jgi:hypothetical protein
MTLLKTSLQMVSGSPSPYEEVRLKFAYAPYANPSPQLQRQPLSDERNLGARHEGGLFNLCIELRS